ncbi:MAG TPA: tetratricopeptide repeat protein [Opitutales bacterium]|nr:tetratricopeptide repeat protein [Opitutales bacterium]
MNLFLHSRTRHWVGALALAVTAMGLGGTTARADLVWTPDGGWQVQGGVLAPLFGDMSVSKSALEAMNRAKSAQQAGHYWSALSQYDQVIKDFPGSVFAPEALFQEGLIYLERRQFESAFDAFDRIIKRYPDYPNFNSVIHQESIVADAMTKFRPRLWGWLPWFKDPQKAVDYFDQISKSAPATPDASIALMKMALISLDQASVFDAGDSAAAAINALKRLINEHPDSMLASNAYQMLADVYSSLVVGPAYDQGSTRQAIRYLDDFLFFYKSSPYAPDAEKKRNDLLDVEARSELVLGDFFYNYRNSNRAALIFYNQAISLAPKSPAATEARASIDKINRGVPPPMTAYDVVFGRYHDPAVSPAEEQGKRIDLIAKEAFASRNAGDFQEQPGPEKVETITGTGEVGEPESLPSFLPAPGTPTAVPGTEQTIPVQTTQPTTPPAGQPLLR